jgi:hypothetical protein
MMLVHRCLQCGALSLNRLAADDLPPVVWDVFEASHTHPPAPGSGSQAATVEILGPAARELVKFKLFGATHPGGLPCLD